MTIGQITDLKKELARHHLAVQQPDDAPLLTPEPVPAMRPYHWAWSTLEPLLRRIREAVSLDPGGSRRTLRLVNPGLPFGTTHTLWAAIQQVLPGEVATAHRHTPTAFRFMFEGSAVSTTVNGEQYAMEPGDLLLTPNWCWHDHQNTGDDLGLWLDGLDIPLVRAMGGMFYEPYATAVQDVLEPPDGAARQLSAPGLLPPRPTASFLPVYKWQTTIAALHSLAATRPDPYDDVLLEYRNPVTGGPALQTIGLAIQMLRPGVQTLSHRQSCSTVYYVQRGQGTTVINGERFSWTERDFLAVPPWAWHEHHNDSSSEEAILFQMNDIPAMRALGFYREEGER